MAYEFRFPDIGEGITEGEIVSWRVKEGDIVAEDQTLAEIETDKAVVELPSPKAGRVLRLQGAEGQVIKVGDVVVVIDEAVAAPAQPVPPAPPVPVPAPPVTVAPAEAPVEDVPYTGSVVGRLEEAPEEEESPAASRPPASAASLSRAPVVQKAPASGVTSPPAAGETALAMPSVRTLAKELGVDLSTIRGTGPGGRILKQDVEDIAERAAYGEAFTGGAAPAPSRAPAAAPAAPVAAPALAPPEDAAPAAAVSAAATPAGPGPGRAAAAPLMGGTSAADGFGLVEHVPFHGIRRTMAIRMRESVAKQAQVTTTDDADVTVLKHIREKERTVAAERGVRLTYLAFAVKACTAALQRFPRLNATLAESGEEFSLKRYYNIGIAIDTKSGLVVPNIKAADEKSIFEIAAEIVDLVERAEQRRLDLQELKGGTFTISNYGAIGGLYATPVINYPEVAILGMGRVRELPVAREGKVLTRLMLPLSLTFDHQLIDGAEATRFLNLVISYLEDPDLMLLEGA
jgi:pyruvate dehydrogenase E2 component (dihydrolipoamide acetyltransferase)